LFGRVIDWRGTPLAGSTVLLVDASRQAVAAQTDEQGRFAFAVPRGGAYAVSAAGSGEICRIWTHRAAPPSAQDHLVLRAPQTIIRGQSSPAYQWISEHPWLFYTGLAAAITVPLVVANSGSDDAPSSP
jgi:hypothetical protein